MKRIAVFCKKNGEEYEYIEEKTFKLTDELVTHKDRSYNPIGASTFVKKDIKYIFFDLANNKALTFLKIDLGIDTEMLDQFIVKKLILQLISKLKSSTETPSKQTLLTYIILLALGIAIGFIVSTFVG